SPVTSEPAESAAALCAFAPAFAFAVTAVAVTSPPRMVIVETSADALAVAEVPGVANAPEVTESARMTEPSAGNENDPPTPTESGGAETDAAELLPWPGTIAWTAKALEAVGEVLAVCSAPAA